MAVVFADLVKDTDKLKSFLESNKVEDINTNLFDESTGCSVLTAAAATVANDANLKMILEFPGIDINAKDKNGFTAFTKCIRSSTFASVGDALVAAGADVSIPFPPKNDQEKETPVYPISFAAEDDNKVLIKMMFNSNTVAKSLNVAVCKANEDAPPLNDLAYFDDNTEYIQKAIELGADVNRTDKYGRSCLFWAVYNSRQNLMKILVKAGAKMDIEPDTLYGYGLLHCVASSNMEEIANLVMELALEVDPEKNVGKNLLTMKGAPNTRFGKDMNAYEYAIEEDNKTVAGVLKKYMEEYGVAK